MKGVEEIDPKWFQGPVMDPAVELLIDPSIIMGLFDEKEKARVIISELDIRIKQMENCVARIDSQMADLARQKGMAQKYIGSCKEKQNILKGKYL